MDISHPQMNHPIPGIRHIYQAVGQRPPTTHTTAKAKGCSPQSDSKAPLLKTAISAQLIEHRELELEPTCGGNQPIYDLS